MALKHIFAFAGIPSGDVFDRVHSRLQNESNLLFFASPMKSNYSIGYAKIFARHFAQRIENDHHNDLSDTTFSVICASHPADLFLDFLFPEFLTCHIDWQPDYSGTQMAAANSANQLYLSLLQECKRVVDAQHGLYKELIERSNRTPLLLPFRNFEPDAIPQLLVDTQALLRTERDTSQGVRKLADRFTQNYLHKPQKEAPDAFLNARSIVFKAPGRDKHGFARRIGENHTEKCLLTSRRRLGAPFAPSFHWDCTRLHQPQKKLEAMCFECHGLAQQKLEGEPHLNIAPNDYTRR
jgi:hypothetical protein